MTPAKLEDLKESAVLLAQAPPPFARLTLYACILLAAVLGIWSYMVHVPVIVLAEGRIQPQGRVRLVDSETGGRVVEVLAQEHQRVEQGAPLLRLDPAPLTLELTALERELGTLRPERAELELMAGRLKEYDREKPPPGEGLSGHRQRFAAWLQELELALLTIKRRKEELRRLELIEKVVAVAELVSARLALGEAESTFAVALARHRADVEKDLETAQRNIEALEVQRDQKKDQLGRLEVRSPVRGTITSVSVRHVGEVVKPGQLLFHVAPEGSGFVAEVWIPGHQAGFVNPGMTARVEIPTFPEPLFGWVPGKVAAVSADVASPAEQSGGGSSPALYRIEIALEGDRLTANDGRVGMLRLGLLTRARLIVSEERLLFTVLGTVSRAFRWGP